MLALLALLLAAAWRSEALPISAYDSKVPMEPFCHTNHVACTEAEGNGSNDASIQLDSAMSVNASLRPDPTSRKTVVCSISDAAVARALPEGRCVLDILGRGVISTECLAGIKVHCAPMCRRRPVVVTSFLIQYCSPHRCLGGRSRLPARRHPARHSFNCQQALYLPVSASITPIPCNRIPFSI